MFITTKTYYEATAIKSQPDVGLDRLMRETRAFKHPPTYAWSVSEKRKDDSKHRFGKTG